MVSAVIILFAFAGYYLWQRSRYEPDGAREAHGRALADTAALAAIVACITAAGALAHRLAWTGGGTTLIGAVIGALLSGPTRRAVLLASHVDPRGVR